MHKSKKIIFISNNFVLGGIERALLDNVILLNKAGHEISILARDISGEFKHQVPKGVNVHQFSLREIDEYELENGRKKTFIYTFLSGHWGKFFAMFRDRLKWILGKKKHNFDYISTERMVKNAPEILSETFDYVVAYYADYSLLNVCIALNKINAQKKICWCHSEVTPTQYDKTLYFDCYSKFDFRFACSNATAERINSKIGVPNLAQGFPHFIDSNRIKKLAKNGIGFKDPYDGLRILTCGRLSFQKGIDIAIKVHKNLIDNGFFHKWYIVGSGTIEDNLTKMINDLGVSDTFILLGGTENPYPFFAQCDLYVQPSRYEGYCLTVAEARVFNKPIVATEFDGAREQIKDGITGFVVEHNNENALEKAIESLLKDKELLNKFSENLSKENPDTTQKVLEMWNQTISK